MEFSNDHSKGHAWILISVLVLARSAKAAAASRAQAYGPRSGRRMIIRFVSDDSSVSDRMRRRLRRSQNLFRPATPSPRRCAKLRRRRRTRAGAP
jgi:hypothetical protein